MKIILTESQYNNLMEQHPQLINTPLMVQNLGKNPLYADIIKRNKKYLNLAVDLQITPEYVKKINDLLAKKNVDESQRTLMGSLVGLIPVYEQFADFETIIGGILTKSLADVNAGILGLAMPISYKAVTGLIDYVGEKIAGKESADYNAKMRDEILNMGQHGREELFRRYGYGGYDKWVKAGRPKL